MISIARPLLPLFLAWVFLQVISLPVAAATRVLLGTISQITGPDRLDLDGEIVYAINFSADDVTRKIGTVPFTPDNRIIQGATLVGPQQVTGWQTKPEFGPTADANQLEEICHDIRWADSGSGQRLRATLAVIPGDEYKLQLIISANGVEDRRWDIRVDGKDAVDEITSLGPTPNQSYSRSRATLYSCQFKAARSVLVVEMGNLFGVNDGGDRNPIWQALTLEHISVPPTPEDIVISDSKFFPTQVQPIAELTVADRRSGATHELELVPGDGGGDNERFLLRGKELFMGPFNFQSEPSGSAYSVRVRATDATDTTRQLEKAFTLTLAAPHAPTGVVLDAKGIVVGAQPGDLVAMLHAADEDAFDEHRFELVPGAGDTQNQMFSISEDKLILEQERSPGLAAAKIRLRAVDRAGLAHDAEITLPWNDSSLRVSEVLAGGTGPGDTSSQPQEWIEIRNERDHYINLAGWSLTDDLQNLQEWKFPSHSLAPNQYLVVPTANSGSVFPPSQISATNFALDAGGEWIGLVRPDGVSVESFLEYPLQIPGVAYGRGPDGRVGFLSPPTPGAANPQVSDVGENRVKFSRPHGFFTNTIALELQAALPGSRIYFTLDGSVPSESAGTAYTGPISITPSAVGPTKGTRMVRGVAIHPDAAYAPVATQTYFFVSGVSGPAVDGVVSQSRLLTSITRNATYGPLLKDAFLALPALSVILPSGPTTTERAGSIELVDPLEREPGFQIDCGIAASGTTSLGSPKLSMSARFRSEYGQSKLRYPVFAQGSFFPQNAATEFKQLRLRSHSHDTFFWLGTRENPPTPYGNPPVRRSGDAQLTRNPWIDEMQLMMGQPGKHGRQVHLFLNGAYHGIYHIHEHADENFMGSYYAGSADDYEFTGGATAGSEGDDGTTWRTAWNELKSSLGNYTQARRWVDVTNLCDYMILSFYAGNDWDWSTQHNWSAAGPSQPDRGGWKFFQQDSDIALQDIDADCTDQDAPDGIFTSLMRTTDFRILFRDRVYKHCFGSGALTPARAGALYEARMNEISTAIIAETARWQPSSSVAALPWDRDQEWTNEWRYLRDRFFPQRTTRLIEQFRKHSGWWPVDPPIANSPQGPVPLGSLITFSNRTGTVYYTMDGSDPRLPGGAINTASALTNSPLMVDRPISIRARVRAGIEWSPLVESFWMPDQVIPASAANLVISEIQYHPLDESQAEYIELLNTSQATVDLSGVRISDAVEFTFPAPTVLDAGERLVVVKDPVIFDLRYGTNASPYFRNNLRRYGPWAGSLSNSGETIEIFGAENTLLFKVAFGTGGDWPGRADGKGSSLELIDPARAPQTAPAKTAWLGSGRHWRPSAEFHGSPSTDGITAAAGVVINELFSAAVDPGSDAMELFNLSEHESDLSGWFLSDSSSDYRKYRFPDGTRLPPGARLVLRESDFNNAANPAARLPFAFDQGGDDAYLVAADSSEALLRFVDVVRYGAIPVGISLGRFPDGTGPIAWLQEPTLGGANGAPVPGYDAWASVAFPPGTPVAWTLRDADPDGDGLDNLAEYAFAASPLVLDGSAVAISGGSPVNFVDFSYRIRTASAELSYTVEISSDLQVWVPAGLDLERISESANAEGSTLVTSRISAGEEQLFIRVTAKEK